MKYYKNRSLATMWDFSLENRYFKDYLRKQLQAAQKQQIQRDSSTEKKVK